MTRFICTILSTAFGASLAAGTVAAPCDSSSNRDLDTPVPVTLVQSEGRFELLRAGQPYFIRGAGGSDHLELLAASGGNSIRTWGTEQTAAVIDRAHELGLTVLAGIWIEHERHGFDYDDEAEVQAQIAAHRAAVDRFKDHPAILMWGVGNEVSLGEAKNPRVYDVIEAVAAYIKEVDPLRPVMTVLPHVSAREVSLIRERCPSIDLLGFNTYAGIDSIGRDARRAGWDGPFVITEWGTDGNWEVDATPWGAEIETTTTERAALMGWRYTRILEDPHCLGAYCFLWGQKQETTPTWFNLFLENGASFEAVDVLHYLWSGSLPEVRAPALTPLLLNGRPASDGVVVYAGDILEVATTVWRGEIEPLKFRWELLPESADKGAGGDPEDRPESVEMEILENTASRLRFRAPAETGPYRIFIYLENDARKAASANFPFYVEEAVEGDPSPVR